MHRRWLTFPFKHRQTTLLGVALLLLTLQSCQSKKYTFASSAVVPAAEGTIKVEPEDNGNYEIELQVTNLAEPSRLQPARKLYIVWAQTEKEGNRNIGQLKMSTGFLSSTLKSSLHSLSPFKPVGFLISAEDDLSVAQPRGPIVLQTATEP